MKQIYQTFIVSILFFLCTCPIVKAQVGKPPKEREITIEAKNMPLHVLFDSITNQTGVRFFYMNSIIDDKRPIRGSFRKESIEKALKFLFKGDAVDWKYTPDNKVQFITSKDVQGWDKVPEVIAPKKPVDTFTINGQIFDMEGKGIERASVVLKGKKRQNGVTDSVGTFSFSGISGQATLTVSCIGYKSKEERIAANQSEIRIVLQDIVQEMRGVEIVSTGFQNIKKDSSVGSFGVAGRKLIDEQVSTSITTRIPYIINGLSTIPKYLAPTGNGFMIRGPSTFSGDNELLIILNNFPYHGRLENINPEDIEKVTLLKDAVAASIWGVKAGNGVMVITTKKSKYNAPLCMTFNASVTIGAKPNLFSMNTMNSADLINEERSLFLKGYYDEKLPRLSHYSTTPVGSILLKERQGLISGTEANAQLDKLRASDLRKEFRKYLLENAVNQQYAVSISGGKPDHAVLFSLGYDRNKSALSEREERATGRLSHGLKPVKNLEFTTTAFFTLSNNTSGKPAYKDFKGPQYAQLFDQNGKENPQYTYGTLQEGYIDTLGGGRLLDWKYYPLQNYKHQVNKTNVSALNVEWNVEYKLKMGLSASVKYNFEHQKIEKRLYQGLQSYYTRDLINSFSQISDTVNYIVPKGGILDKYTDGQTAHNVRGQINFERRYNKHQIVAIAGGQVSSFSTSVRSSRVYGIGNSAANIAGMDFERYYPHLATKALMKIRNTSMSDEKESRYVTVYGNGTYTYDGRYAVYISARHDGTNSFGENTNNRWKPLMAAGLSWSIAQERFCRSKWLPVLKLRISYGESGGVSAENIGETTIEYRGTNELVNLPVARIVNNNNPGLKWEVVRMMNIGIDFALKNERLSGSFEFYDKPMEDLYGGSPIGFTAGLGVNTVLKNYGVMRGRGIDVELNSINKIGAFTLILSLVGNYYAERVIRIKNEDDLNLQEITGGKPMGLDGYPLYSLFSFPSAKLDPVTGAPRGYLNNEISMEYEKIMNADANVSDLKFAGSMLPKLTGSWRTGVRWEGFTLTACIIYKLGYYFRRTSINYDDLANKQKTHGDYYKRWKKKGDERFTTVPSLIMPDGSDRALFYSLSSDLDTKGDHVRIGYVNLNYEILRSKIRGAIFDNIQVYAVLNDPGIIWRKNKYDLDPDNEHLRSASSVAFGTRISF